ncbi:pentatricopeptide repeat-containing protein At1g20230-like [Wolffia australiana]
MSSSTNPLCQASTFQLTDHRLPRSIATRIQTHLPLRRHRRFLHAGDGVEALKSKSSLQKRSTLHAVAHSIISSPPIENRWPVLFSEHPTNSSITSDHHLLEGIPKRTVAQSANLISSLVSAQQWSDVLPAFSSMLREGLKPDKFLLPKLLKACAELRSADAGSVVHGYALKRWQELNLDAFVANSLINMYGSCGDLSSARKVFDTMPEKDVVSWTALLSAYTATGLVEEAAEIFARMREDGVRPDVISWNAMISAFAREGNKEAALDMLEAMKDAGLVPGINSWNGLLSGFVQSGGFEDAMDMLVELWSCGPPNAVSAASVLPACSGMRSLVLGRAIHGYAVKRDFVSGNVFVGGALVDMYMKCGECKDAEKVFVAMETRSSTVWNEMVAGWATLGELEKAMQVMRMMVEDGFKPDVVTVNTVLAAYARRGKREEAFRLVSEMREMGLKPNIVSINALISGFQQCGLQEEALGLVRVFQNSSAVVGFPSEMVSSSVKVNAVTVTSALAACADLDMEGCGREVHGFVLRNGLELNVFVSTSLVDMYAKCGNMDYAVRVFYGSRERNTATWNSMMAGYHSSGEPEKAMKLFSEMLCEVHFPSSITLLILLQVCSTMSALSWGRALHGLVMKIKNMNYDPNSVHLECALIDMYAKCGSIQEARLAFDLIEHKDLASWNAMTSGYSFHAMAEEAISVFREMQRSDISPNNITFTSVLSSCRQDGFMEIAFRLFDQMEEVYGVKPGLEHYTCMVRIMGGAGMLEDALSFIQRMPGKPDACTWNALLLSCRKHSNYRIGKVAADVLFELEPRNPSNYIILSNIYAAAGMWESALEIRHLMRERGLKQPMACSWTYIHLRAHVFEAGGKPHQELNRVLEEWDRLAMKMESLGYVPEDPYLDELETDPFSCFHTEKLALCYGLISSPPGVPVRILKNVRMCIDCHTSAKIISKIEGRELIVSDGCHFHHFTNGICSCNDEW